MKERKKYGRKRYYFKEIYEEYPILNRIQNQDDLIQWIDEQINEALKTLRKIIESNKQTE